MRKRYWHNVCWVSSLETMSVQARMLEWGPNEFNEGATQGSLWHTTLVACFAPDRVNETDGVSILSPAVWPCFGTVLS